ncbi:phytanoyl-CoA dioxygenase family protein [Myxococcus xanthus]|uniref:Phytanoyl-CoA dioxygenase n=1 Tax=Myxococcus xanthus TaxID=34 RepID=A0AAE6KTR0_MYXXA|nr:phytanoyl-CoA dioxygenase family protein [Myxococcus xanthus]QDE69516.1 phytanoyl-CoA dioxygenase [Myxococcus xanthus]QDE76794.1 phytanoyl-CoA dioxygenase [Myxococcus xanthus]QDE84183.1 phytanoyl-CoA dioxygenase [Myxococcus xanthus]QDE98356.1 phytanoyl-CoA dioxygenase [Myxococcus xanthus]QDF06045.1 phytanoyl-CoA dioxygenase [Myxococcus xanthus]
MELSPGEVEQFIERGFVRLDQAFPRELADTCRELLWRDTGCAPDNPATWKQPVIRLGDYAQEPFRLAANTPRLRGAFDQLVGPGRWLPRGSLGTFPVRFPSPDAPGDDGWHVDASFPGEDPSSFFSWRVNVASKGRALLMLFLFSDVGEDDAPTRIRAGSHRDIARVLAPEGDAGLTFMELAGKLDVSAHRPLALATGEAGTVYLCHPFLVHAAQPHQGTRPRFMAQPPLLSRAPFAVQGPEDDASPVARAIRQALNETRA